MNARPWIRGFFVRLGVVLSATLGATVACADPIILSSGHADVFEVEYQQVGVDPPTLHLGVHTADGHFEPADVLLQVKYAAFKSTAGLPSPVTTILGTTAWILPADSQEALDLGVLDAGVARVGFPNTSPLTLRMLASGSSNPGNFALFTAGNAVRLSTSGGSVTADTLTLTAGHVHYNWGFSAAGTYTFDMQASYTDPTFGLVQSPVETYTFQVMAVPEPATWMLAGTALLGLVAVRVTRVRSRRSYTAPT